MPKSRLTLDQRFDAKVEKTDTCWLWIGYVDPYGYGRFRAPGEQRAHRYSYKRTVGPIPAGLVIDHICRVRNCVRPDHLRAVTTAENVFADGSIAPAKRLKESTHCKRGHPFDEANTKLLANGNRMCRACHYERGKAFRSTIQLPAECPEGHPRVPNAAGKLYCPVCHRAKRQGKVLNSPRRSRGRKPPPTTFSCGHVRTEHGAVSSVGRPYCATCRVEKRRKDVCRRGHSMLNPENVYVAPGNGQRFCRSCLALAEARRRGPATGG